jgi:hypothetical protein
MAKMSTSDVQALVNSARTDSLAAMSAMQLTEPRAQAMEYYLGEMQRDMPAEPRRSRAVFMTSAPRGTSATTAALKASKAAP